MSVANRRISLESQVDSLKQEIDQLKLETSVYLKYYEKKKAELSADDEEKKKGYQRNTRQKRNIPTTLTVDQKYDIASAVHEDLQAEIEAHRKNSEKMIDTLRAVLEETEIRIGELKRDAYEFKRDVVVGAENARTGKIMAERVTRYFEEKLKAKDSVIEKLRLKNATLKSQIHKVENQLSQKEEIGDVLHYIDFHQLQIENKQYVAKIEERNEELLAVKMTTGKTLQALNELKQRLSEKLSESERFKNELTDKKLVTAKLNQETKNVTKDVHVEKRMRNKLRQQMEESKDLPNIEDYIYQKRVMYDLQGTLKNWQKKVDILEMAAKKSRTLHHSSSMNAIRGNTA
mmetsp:Transcript_5370/g.5535  ORF Transcript_5370/g.5535 Transcript_5370/m.5535 type:complete len:346 (+) Transcript_5370:106-1143(+)